MKFKRLTSESSVYTVYTKGNEEAQITKQKNSKSKRGDSAQRYFFFGRMSFSTQNHNFLRHLVGRVRVVLRLRALAQLGVAVAVGGEARVQLVRGERHHGEQQQRRQRHLRVHRLGQRRALLSEQQRLVLGAEPRLGGGRLVGRHELAVGVGALAELALAGALALVASDLVAAHLVRLGGIAVAAAHLHRRGRRRGRRHLAVAVVIRDQELAAHVLAARAARRLRAAVIGLVAVAAVAAAHLLGGRRGGGPHRLAVLVLAQRLERAALLAVAVLKHQALRLGGEGLAVLHPAGAVGDVWVAIAAARLRRRLRKHQHAVLLEDAVLDELARRAVVALVHVLDGVALLVARHGLALAAARHRRRGRRLGRCHDAVVRVVGHQELALHGLAASAVGGARASVVGFVAVAAVAAAHLLGRGGGRGPHRLAILVLAERLEHAALHSIAVLELQALGLGAEDFALLRPALAVCRVGVAVAAARLRRRIRVDVEHAVDVEDAERDELARRAPVAPVHIQQVVTRVVGRARGALAAPRRLRGGGRGDHAVHFGDAAAHELAARRAALAVLAVVEADALGLVPEARALAAARLRRGGRRRGPHHRAVHVLVHRLERAARHAVAVRQLQALPLRLERDARVLVLFAVRLVRVDVAAARLLGRRRLERAVGVRSGDPLNARRRSLALGARVASQAHFLAHLAVRLAAAHLLRRGWRLGGGHDAVARVVGHEEAAAHVLAAVAVQGAESPVVGLVAVVAVAAAHLLRRGRRRGPQHRAVHVLVHRLEHAARHAVLVRLHQTLALREKGNAHRLVALAVRHVGVDVAAARLRRRLRGAVVALAGLQRAALHEVAARRALAQLARRPFVAHRVRLRAVALAAAHLLGRGWRLGGGHDAIVRVVGLEEAAAHVLAAIAVRGARATVVGLVVGAVAAARRVGRRRRHRRRRRLHADVAAHVAHHAPAALVVAVADHVLILALAVGADLVVAAVLVRVAHVGSRCQRHSRRDNHNVHHRAGLSPNWHAA